MSVSRCFVLLMLLTVAYGCGDDGKGAGTTFPTPDMGGTADTTPEADTDMLGDTSSGATDIVEDTIPEEDTLSDTTAEDAPSDTEEDLPDDIAPDITVTMAVTVSVYRPLPDDLPPVPVEGGMLSVADATGSWVGTWQTDADGLATIDPIPVGGSISLITERENGTTVETIFGVEPGDSLRFGEHRDYSRNGGAMEYTLSASPMPGGDALLVTPCINPENSARLALPAMGELPLDEGCVDEDGTVDAVSLQYTSDLISSPLVAVGLQEDIVVSGEEPDMAASVAMDAWLSDPGMLNVTFTDNSEALGGSGVQLRGKRGSTTFAVVGDQLEPMGDTTVELSGAFDARVFDSAELRIFRFEFDIASGSQSQRAALYGLSTIPGAGETQSATYSDADLPPALAAASVEFGGRGALLTGLEEAPTCGGETADAVLGSLYNIDEDGPNVYWLFASPYAARISPPEFDPELGIWPETITEAVADIRVLTASAKSYADLRQEDYLFGGLLFTDSAAPDTFICEATANFGGD